MKNTIDVIKWLIRLKLHKIILINRKKSIERSEAKIKRMEKRLISEKAFYNNILTNTRLIKNRKL